MANAATAFTRWWSLVPVGTRDETVALVGGAATAHAAHQLVAIGLAGGLDVQHHLPPPVRCTLTLRWMPDSEEDIAACARAIGAACGPVYPAPTSAGGAVEFTFLPPSDAVEASLRDTLPVGRQLATWTGITGLVAATRRDYRVAALPPTGPGAPPRDHAGSR